MLATDEVLSFLSFVVGCSVATTIAPGRRVAASVGVGAIGWLVYFFEVGGLSGIQNSRYPLWYELSPAHIGAAFFVAFLSSRRRAI